MHRRGRTKVTIKSLYKLTVHENFESIRVEFENTCGGRNPFYRNLVASFNVGWNRLSNREWIASTWPKTLGRKRSGTAVLPEKTRWFLSTHNMCSMEEKRMDQFRFRPSIELSFKLNSSHLPKLRQANRCHRLGSTRFCHISETASQSRKHM